MGDDTDVAAAWSGWLTWRAAAVLVSAWLALHVAARVADALWWRPRRLEDARVADALGDTVSISITVTNDGTSTIVVDVSRSGAGPSGRQAIHGGERTTAIVVEVSRNGRCHAVDRNPVIIVVDVQRMGSGDLTGIGADVSGQGARGGDGGVRDDDRFADQFPHGRGGGSGVRDNDSFADQARKGRGVSTGKPSKDAVAMAGGTYDYSDSDDDSTPPPYLLAESLSLKEVCPRPAARTTPVTTVPRRGRPSRIAGGEGYSDSNGTDYHFDGMQPAVHLPGTSTEEEVGLRRMIRQLEEEMPDDVLMASRRDEDARVRNGGAARTLDEYLKVLLKLWARVTANAVNYQLER